MIRHGNNSNRAICEKRNGKYCFESLQLDICKGKNIARHMRVIDFNKTSQDIVWLLETEKTIKGQQ